MKSFSRSTPSFATFSAISAALRQKVCENSRASYRWRRSCQGVFPTGFGVGTGFAEIASRQVDVLLGLMVTFDQRTAVESTPAGDGRQPGRAEERLNFHGLQQPVAQREVPGPPARSVRRIDRLVMKSHGQDRSL